MEIGRGSAFVCDETVKNNGGIVVIQTFFSDDPADDVLIPGRLVRQGQRSSSKLIVHVNDLLQLNFTLGDIEAKIQNQTNIYQEALAARNNKYSEDMKEILTKTQSVEHLHSASVKLQEKLMQEKPNATEITDLFYKLAPPCFITQGYHFVVALDSSGSMGGPSWNGLANAVKEFADFNLLVRYSTGRKDIISIVLYDHSATIQCESLQITEDLDVNACLKFKGGGTNFAAGLNAARQILDKSDHRIYNPVLLFLSDGECGNGDEEMSEIANRFSGYNLAVKVLAFGSFGTDRLKHLARLGGGEFVHAVSSEELGRAFLKIAMDISLIGRGARY